MAHDPADVETGRRAIALGLIERARALAVLDRATAERCGFVEAARRSGVDGETVARLLAVSGAVRPTPTGGASTVASPPSAIPTGTGTAPERAPLPEVGETLAGFRLERLLGRGGMGAVYTGVTETGLRRAIKVPLFSGPGAHEDRARFTREQETLGRLGGHPHIVKVHGAGVDRGFCYCVLELVEGEGCDRLVKRGPVPIDRALAIAEQVGSALAHAHGLGVLHRDLKPANVMLRAEDGSAVLMDFGLAYDKDAERLTQSGVMLGTPAYMPPEQAEGRKDIDERADVYGLGATLYELIVGRPPFEGSSAMELVKKVCLDQPVSPRARRKDCPPAVEAIVLRALAKERLSRYRNVKELVDDLGSARRGESVTARAPTAREKLGWRWRRIPRARRLALVGVALAVVGAGVAFAAASGLAARSPARRWRAQRDELAARLARELDAARPARVGAPVRPARLGDEIARLLASAGDARIEPTERSAVGRELERAAGELELLASLAGRPPLVARQDLSLRDKLAATGSAARVLAPFVELARDPSGDDAALLALRREAEAGGDPLLALEAGLGALESRLARTPPDLAGGREVIAALQRQSAALGERAELGDRLRRLRESLPVLELVANPRGPLAPLATECEAAARRRAFVAVLDHATRTDGRPEDLLRVAELLLQGRLASLLTGWPDGAPPLLRCCSRALARPGGVLLAFTFLRAARSADPAVILPDDVRDAAKAESYAAAASDEACRGWLRFACEAANEGLYWSYVPPPLWEDEERDGHRPVLPPARSPPVDGEPSGRRLRQSLEDLAKERPLEPGPCLLLAHVCATATDYGRALSGSELRLVSRALGLALNLAARPDARGFTRAFAWEYVGRCLTAFVHVVPERLRAGLLADAARALKAAVACGHGRPDDLLTRGADALLAAQDRGFGELARLATEAADDRAARMAIGQAAAFARGRPPGLPLDATQGEGSGPMLVLRPRLRLLAARALAADTAGCDALIADAERLEDEAKLVSATFRCFAALHGRRREEGLRLARDALASPAAAHQDMFAGGTRFDGLTSDLLWVAQVVESPLFDRPEEGRALREVVREALARRGAR